MNNEVKGFRADRGLTMQEFVEKKVSEIRSKVGKGKVLLGLSGGVDSSVCAALLAKAIPGQTVCIFVDHGFMRKNEGDEIEAAFSKKALTFVRVNAQDRFLEKLKGVTDPEQKRKIIGGEFIRVFEEQAALFDDIEYLAQGTIYADIVESGKNGSGNVKSHHNVGGLPENMKFKDLVEPLRDLYKDEVRALGKLLSLPSNIVSRQPFPGPGLAVRVIGELTREKLDILREADAILREEFKKSRVKANQYFAILTGLRSVGVQSESRTYEYTVALRAIATDDYMTCEFVRVPYSALTRISTRITSEVSGVNRVVYDITSKPPATVEWE